MTALFTARPTPAGRMGRPDNGISAPFGYSKQYRGGKYFHHGIDSYWLNADPAGSRKVFSVGKGVVVAIWWSDIMGGCIRVRMNQVDVEYCHMPRGSSAVRVGQEVTDQTYLGQMGNAGTAAFNQYHLHMQCRPAGANPALENRIDPEPYFTTGGTIPMNPNQRQVKANAFSNKRSTPEVIKDPSNIIGTGAANAIITMTEWKRGQKQANGNDVWFTDGKGWFWSGGFTSVSTSGIPEVKPVPVPGPAPVDVDKIVADVVAGIKADLDIRFTRLSDEISGVPQKVRTEIIAPE